MSLIGKYTNKTLNATLELTAANISNGQGSGYFTIGGVSHAISLHFHFNDNVGPATVLQIWADTFAGFLYLGASGSTPSTDGSSGITLAGGVSTVNSTHGFSGLFTK
jgi:hypothetical protein